MKITNQKKKMVNVEEDKIGIIVPYRNREVHLKKFLSHIERTLKEQKLQYEVIIVQQDDTKSFNRGKLLNIGFKRAVEMGCTYVCFHDVDMLPIDVDYSKVDKPTHMATEFEGDMERTISDFYFGGVTMFPIADFEKLNGYSNKYWGWGYEDDDLLQRYRVNFDDHNIKKIPQPISNSVGMKFDGKRSYIEVPKNFSLRNYTILISCEPETIENDPNEQMDEYSIFTIPGYDMGFTYDSFRRYKFQTWNYRKELYQLTSDISEARKTVLAVTVNQETNEIMLFQDGKKVDELVFSKKLRRYDGKSYAFIGKSGSEYNQRQHFKGIVDYFAIWNHSLEEEQLKVIYDNLHMGLSAAFPGYEAPHCLEICYDMKASTWETVFDLSGNARDGLIFDCDRVMIEQKAPTIDMIIPWRRNGKFFLLKHEENGYVDNKWKQPETRKNQIMFNDRILAGNFDETRDGLSTLRFRLNEEINEGNIHTLKVRL